MHCVMLYYLHRDVEEVSKQVLQLCVHPSSANLWFSRRFRRHRDTSQREQD